MPSFENPESTIALTHLEAWRAVDALLESAYVVEESPALDEQVKAKENFRVADLISRRIHEG